MVHVGMLVLVVSNETQPDYRLEGEFHSFKSWFS